METETRHNRESAERLPPAALEHRPRAEEELALEHRRMEREIADTEAAAKAEGISAADAAEIAAPGKAYRAEEAAAKAEFRQAEENPDLDKLVQTLKRDRILGLDEHQERLREDYPNLSFGELPAESVYKVMDGTHKILRGLEEKLGAEVLRKIPLRVIGGGDEALRLARNGVLLINPLAGADKVITAVENSKLVRELARPATEKSAMVPEEKRNIPPKEKKDKKENKKSAPAAAGGGGPKEPEGPRGPEAEKMSKTDFMHLLQGFERAFPNARVKFRYGEPGADGKAVFQKSRQILVLLHKKLGAKLPVLAEIYFRTSGENRFVRSRLPYLEVNINSGTPEEIAAAITAGYETARKPTAGEAMIKAEKRRGEEWYEHLENRYRTGYEAVRKNLEKEVARRHLLPWRRKRMLAAAEDIIKNVREEPLFRYDLDKLGFSGAFINSALELRAIRQKVAAGRREHLSEFRGEAPGGEERAMYKAARGELYVELLAFTEEHPEKSEAVLKQAPGMLKLPDAAKAKEELQDLGLTAEQADRLWEISSRIREYAEARRKWFAPSRERIAEKAEGSREEKSRRLALGKYGAAKNRLTRALGEKLAGKATILVEGRAESPESQDRMLQNFADAEKFSKHQTRLLWEARDDIRAYRLARSKLEAKLYEEEEERLLHETAKKWPPEKRAEGDEESIRVYREAELHRFRKKMRADLDLKELEYMPPSRTLRENPPEDKGFWSRVGGRLRREKKSGSAAPPGPPPPMPSIIFPPPAKASRKFDSVLPPIREEEKINSVLPPRHVAKPEAEE